MTSARRAKDSGRRAKDIKLLVEKFVRLVESLNPGERLTIRKVSAKKPAGAGKSPAKKRRAGVRKT